MSQQQIAKLWTIMSLALLYYAMNTWLVTQGGAEIFDVKLILSGRVTAALMAIPICAILMAITSCGGALYAKRTALNNWHARIPVVGFEEIDTSSTEGRWYQALMLVLFSVLPAFALVHFWLIVSGAPVITTGATPRMAANIWDPSAMRGLDDPARICGALQAGKSLDCLNGATFFPFIEPLIFSILIILAMAFTTRQWFLIFLKR
jgi:hypothetical protein